VVDRFKLDPAKVSILESYDDMLFRKLDAVFVVTSPATRAEFAVQAMQGKRNSRL